MKLSELIGTKVYSIFDCVEVGYVLGACFNKKYNKIVNLVIANDDEEQNYVLNTKNIYANNKDCVLIKNLTKVFVSELEPETLLHNTLLDVSGECTKIGEVILTKNLEVEKLVGQNFEITPLNLLFKNKNILLCNKNNSEIKRKNFRPRTKKLNLETTNYSQSVKILENSITKPKTIVASNPQSVVGKRLIENLVSNNQQILAYKNSIITYNTLDIAKEFDIIDKLLKLAK